MTQVLGIPATAYAGMRCDSPKCRDGNGNCTRPHMCMNELRESGITATRGKETIPMETGKDPRELIPAGLFTRLTYRIQVDDDLDAATAGRIMEQALAFLAVCAENPGGRLVPSEMVDKGWHAFLLHTYEYNEFCETVAGRYIHHRPTPPGEREPGAPDLGAAITAIREAGYTLDPDLWDAGARCNGGPCSQCYAGCHDDPRGA